MNSSSTVEQIKQHLTQAQSRQFSGRLILQGQGRHSTPWLIDFKLGMIVWVGQSHHRNRRWMRVLKECCPAFLEHDWSRHLPSLQEGEPLTEDHWEIKLLEQGWRNGSITIAQCQSILDTYLLESVISLSNCDVMQDQWLDDVDIPKLLVIPSIQTVVDSAAKWQQQRTILCQQYSEALLSQLSFDLAPIIAKSDTLKAQVNALVYGRLSKILTGENTFWDIASLMQQSWISVACVLLPLFQSQTIEFREIGDINFRTDPPAPIASRTNLSRKADKTIACIDDSPVIAKELERILKPQGYEVLSILDPIKGLATLIKAQPCFIFLDLVMPNTNGYEICSFLRRSPQFKDLPIVMLTGHDGIVDRLKAKMAGSSDFIGKPPEPTKVIQVVQKHLKKTSASPASNTITVSSPSFG